MLIPRHLVRLTTSHGAFLEMVRMTQTLLNIYARTLPSILSCVNKGLYHQHDGKIYTITQWDMSFVWSFLGGGGTEGGRCWEKECKI